MKLTASAICVLLVPSLAHAQHGQHSANPAAPAPLIAGAGNLHHPVSTSSAEAQRFFDQGLCLSFAFNHDEAFRSFQRAAALDPKLAMAYWGMALVLGPNINLPIDDARSRQANELILKARELASGASAHERAYVEALAKRYDADPKADRGVLDRAYKEAMGQLSRSYPDDLDAAALYAEAAMDLRPWQYWTPDGKPAEGTEEIVSVLESVLRRQPDHIGANHLLIHALEASPNPERALGAAQRLEQLAPGDGHLVHMPSHIYARLGDYERSARINDQAATVDRQYIARYKVQGMYPVLYFNHNLHFSSYSYTQAGDFVKAIRSARELYSHAAPAVKEMPMAEMFTLTPMLVEVRFRRWDEVLSSPEPGAELIVTRGVRRFGRGMAHAAKGDLPKAEAERGGLDSVIAALPQDAMVGFSSAKAVLGLAGHLLDAKIAEARGQSSQAADHLARAVEAEDQLPYDEPPDWYLHARESLGGLLLRQGKPADAEKVFRADLERNPRNARSLFGLAEALRAEGNADAAATVEREFHEAWAGSAPLAVADL